MNAAVFFDLSQRAKFRITGGDRLRFLNGQITNDVRKASATSAMQGCVLNAKGKVEAEVFVSIEADSFLLDADPGLRDVLPARLDRYIIADDVQLENITDHFALFHVIGDAPPAIAEGARMLRANRFDCAGWDIWNDRTGQGIMRQRLANLLPFYDGEAAEILRIERGIPRWGRELTEEIIPIEANLESGAIDYAKGCYIGQEVISRMKMSGQTNKRLCGLVSADGASLSPGMRLWSGQEQQKDVGWITSTARSERLQKEIALGYVKRGFNAIGTQLRAIVVNENTSAHLPVEVVTIPFV
ncbi:MAG: glycine cleavage T C-terminal barrel domain-containing protein [Verrucomicrobiota bacterium]